LLAVLVLLAVVPSAFAMSDNESGYERGMNDVSVGCNPNECHMVGLNNQTGKFTNGYFDGFCAIRPNTNQAMFMSPSLRANTDFYDKGLLDSKRCTSSNSNRPQIQ
jgi:hypothetical protein